MRCRFRVSPCIVLAFVLAASPALAERPAPDQRTAVSDLMVWELPAGIAARPAAELVVEVLKSGVAVYTESATVELPPVEGRRGIEVLGAAAETRALFAAMAERGNVTMEAVVSLDGQVVERLPVTALLENGAALGERATKLMPLRYPEVEVEAGDAGDRLFAVTAAGWDCTNRNACMDDCWDDYLQCNEFFCDNYEDPYGPYPRALPVDDCPECEDARYYCEQSCPGCTCVDPKSVTTYTTSTYLGRSWFGSQCYDGWTWDNQGTWWDQYQYTYRVDEYEKTTYCDNTTSTRLLRSWYEYPTCWEEWWLTSCYAYMTGTPWPQCY